MKKLFFDTEFTGLRQDTTLISLGIIAESGEVFYAEFTDYNKDAVDDWLQKNVINNLYLHLDMHPNTCRMEDGDKRTYVYGESSVVQKHLAAWFTHFDKETVQIWSDCLAYDWVLFCGIFGGAFFIPKNVYYIPMDIATVLGWCNVDPDIKREEYAAVYLTEDQFREDFGYNHVSLKHNSLWDAYVIYCCYKRLKSQHRQSID